MLTSCTKQSTTNARAILVKTSITCNRHYLLLYKDLKAQQLLLMTAYYNVHAYTIIYKHYISKQKLRYSICLDTQELVFLHQQLIG